MHTHKKQRTTTPPTPRPTLAPTSTLSYVPTPAPTPTPAPRKQVSFRQRMYVREGGRLNAGLCALSWIAPAYECLNVYTPHSSMVGVGVGVSVTYVRV